MSRFLLSLPMRRGLHKATRDVHAQVAELVRDYAEAYDISEDEALDVILRAWGARPPTPRAEREGRSRRGALMARQLDGLTPDDVIVDELWSPPDDERGDG